MADLTYIQQAQEVKITGQDTTGTTVNYVSADANGNLAVKDAADGTAGSAVPTTVTQVGGTDGTDLRALSTDTSGRVNIGAINNALPAGTNSIGTVKAELQDNSGTGLTSTLINAKQGLDSNIIAYPSDSITTGTISALNGTVQADGGLQPYTTFYAELSGTFSAGSEIGFEQSTDGTNWSTLYCILVNTASASPNNAYIGGGGRLPLRGILSAVRFVRARAITFQAADSISVKIILSASQGSTMLEAALPSGSNTIGGVTQSGTWLVTSKTEDGSGNNITSTAITSGTKQALNTTSEKVPLTVSSPTTATVGVATGVVIATNANRKGLTIVNVSANKVSFGLGVSAVLNSGITLYPGGVWVMDEFTFTIAAVNGIASAASSVVSIQEFTL